MNKVMALGLIACALITTPVMAEEQHKEILFRDIPWETTYSKVCEMLPEMNFWELHGEMFQTYSKDEILYGDGKGIDFSEDAFNVIASAFEGEQEVAGYTTTGVEAYFVFPVIDDKVVEDVDNARFYGATYKFEPRDLQQMNEDIKSKLTSIYGEPTAEKEDYSWTEDKYVYTLWETDTATLGLRAVEYSDLIELPDTFYISYVYNKADDMLTEANDAMASMRNDKESENYGTENTNGL